MPSDKELTPTKDFIPEENQNPEIINEIKRIAEQGKKVNRNKIVYKSTNKTYDFRNLKQHALLVTKLKIMLLMTLWQIMNKTSY